MGFGNLPTHEYIDVFIEVHMRKTRVVTTHLNLDNDTTSR